MANTKTKAVVALGLLDIARQAAHAYSARQKAEQERLGFGAGMRQDIARLASTARDRVPSGHLEWDRDYVVPLPRWHRQPTFADRMRTWGPIGLVIGATAAMVIIVARRIAQTEPELSADQASTDSRMVGALRAGSQAIDAGVNKVVEGGSAAAVGTASVVAAGSSAVKAATVHRAKLEIDDRVVRPAKQKAIVYGSLGVAALTVYVIIIAVAVQLVVAALS